MPHKPVMRRSDRAYKTNSGKFRETLYRKNYVYILVRVRVVVVIVRYGKFAYLRCRRYGSETRVPFPVLHVERTVAFKMNSRSGYYRDLGLIKASLKMSPRNIAENKRQNLFGRPLGKKRKPRVEFGDEPVFNSSHNAPLFENNRAAML